MSAPLSILHVAQPLTAGVPRVVDDLVADQIARGWRVSIACPGESTLVDAARRHGAQRFNWAATRGPGPSLPDEARRLRRLIREARPDLVHLHSTKAGLAGRLALRGAVPTLFQPHAWSFLAAGMLSPAAAAWERLAARWADAIICVSADERRRGEQAGIGARWAEVPNGVDIERYPAVGTYEREASRATLGLDDGPIALVVGRLCRQKGQDRLIGAWGQIRRQVPAARLILVGDGPERGALQRQADRTVYFAGAQADVRPWLAAADVVVIPSRWEAGSLVVLEAMSSARNVVATDVDGMREALMPGCGATVSRKDARALVEAVSKRRADPAFAEREAIAGRRRVEERYSLEATTARMAEVYCKTLAARSPTSGHRT